MDNFNNDAGIEQLNHLKSLADPSLSGIFDGIIEFYKLRQWHQLTLELEELVRDQKSKNIRIELYESFIKGKEDKLNPLKFVNLCLAVAREFPTKEESLKFLVEISQKVKHEDAKQAEVLVSMEIASTILHTKSIKGIQDIIDKCQITLDSLNNVEPIIYAHFYNVAADFYKARGEFSKYYNHALLYLSCIKLEDLTPEEQSFRAYDLAISALMGETIFNFGELLMHPISKSLNEKNTKWLYTLLLTFNAGEIGKFDSLVPYFVNEKLLQENSASLKQKIILMGLVEFIFNQDTNAKLLSFKNIAVACQIPVNEVEHLIMRSLALGLIKGSIDQVASTVTVDWVMPRYLDVDQLKVLSHKLGQWSVKVKQVVDNLTEINPELAV